MHATLDEHQAPAPARLKLRDHCPCCRQFSTNWVFLGWNHDGTANELCVMCWADARLAAASDTEAHFAACSNALFDL